MAITGNLAPITPGSRGAGFPHLVNVPEASSQTYYLGAPVAINASGVIAAAASNATLLYGFAAKAGQNGASDGAKTAAVYKITPGAIFEATLSVSSWDQSYVGSKVAYSVISSVPVLVTSTALSASAQFVVLGASSAWAAGDSKPVVYFTVLNADQQGGV